MKINIKTLGCRLNQAESDKIIDDLRSFGINISNTENDADLYIINTCCITHTALKKSRQEIHKIRNREKGIKIWVCGCAKELESEADLFIENKEEIPKILAREFLNEQNNCNGRVNILCEDNKRTRVFIKIQDGCNNRCTYCIIPGIRGKSKSLKAGEIIERIREKEKAGFKEIVLTGVSIGQYEYDRLNLTMLVKKILKTTNVPRIRFSSINPESIGDEFIGLFNDKRLCRHLHLSLQSGCDSVLQRMGRKYDRKRYQEVVEKIYKKYPDFNFTTDIIVGFPGETDEEFSNTCEFVKKIGFSKIHIFRYSKREGTGAALMQNMIDERVKRNRAEKLKDIANSLKEKFYLNMLGKECRVLFEGNKGDIWQGFTNNYIRVKYQNDSDLKNNIKRVIISKDNLIL